jgi:hypothetical protein
MSDLKAVAGWIFGRFLVALIVFQILGLGAPWEPELSATARLLAIAVTPGSIELLVIVGKAWNGDF